MRRHFITGLFLFLAVALYLAGMAMPATLLLVLGLLAEGVFWLRLLRRSGVDNKK